jgi:hypothetical protein
MPSAAPHLPPYSLMQAEADDEAADEDDSGRGPHKEPHVKRRRAEPAPGPKHCTAALKDSVLRDKAYAAYKLMSCD